MKFNYFGAFQANRMYILPCTRDLTETKNVWKVASNLLHHISIFQANKRIKSCAYMYAHQAHPGHGHMILAKLAWEKMGLDPPPQKQS